MSVPSAFFKDDKLAKAQYHEIDLFFNVTGGAASLISAQQAPAIVVDAAADSSQALVNSLLQFDSSGAALSASSTSEIAYTTACGTTALGADAVAVILMCAGQVKKSIAAWAHLYSSVTFEDGSQTDETDAVTVPAIIPVFVEGVDTTVPPNTLTNYLYKTPAGNLFARFVIQGFDTATDAYMHVKIMVELK